VLLPAVDAVLIVAEYGETTSDAAGKSSDLLHRFGAPVLGVVMTNVRDPNAQVQPVQISPPPRQPAQLQP